jgi:hypothetical protein
MSKSYEETQFERWKYLRVKRSSVEGVWEIKLPFWHHRKAQDERTVFVQSLLEKYPHSALWSHSDNASEMKWSFLASSTSPEALRSSYEGSWALLFFDEDQKGLLRDLPAILVAPALQRKLLIDTPAHAMIVSWEDDYEWTFATRDIEHDSH